MRASGVLQRCLSSALSPMHALRRQTLLAAVESLLAGRRLVLMDLARSWIGAERVRAPLKRLDRLLSNRRLCAEREAIYAAMARWLVRHPHPVILVDWSDLKDDKSWHLLRAAVPVGGRSLTLLEMVFPGREQGAPQAERRFLQRLKAILPVDACPILVTDAGFRAPWFRAVSELGWWWVGRLRHRTLVKPVDVANTPEQWVPCRALYVLASTTPRDLGLMDTVRSAPWVCRMIIYGKAACGRKHRTRKGEIARGTASRKHAHREREPWLLVVSPQLQLTARQLTALYRRRMQIEASFRDLKSHRYGNAFEDSLTRKGSRLEILLLLNALATFASWLAGLACEASGLDQWLAPRRCRRRLYSVLRVGREALVRRWPIGMAHDLIDRLKSPDNHWLDQTGAPA
jgi:hypothetical protein